MISPSNVLTVFDFILVSVPPIVSWVIRPKQVKEDRKATFRCKSTGTDYPVTTITWTKDGIPLPMVSENEHLTDFSAAFSNCDASAHQSVLSYARSVI